MNVRGTFLCVTICVGLGGWKLVGLVHAHVRFELVTLFKAHFVVVLAILGGLLGKFRFGDSFDVSVLRKTTFVLGQVIDFVVT